MQISDLDWRVILRTWSREEIMYLISICNEVLDTIPVRKTIIRKR